MKAGPPGVGTPQFLRVRAGLFARIAAIALRKYGNPLRTVAVLARVYREMGRFRSLRGAPKYARAGGRYFWGFYCPGFPSLAFDRFIEAELERLAPTGVQAPALQTAVVAITRSCPLACQHCCEWATLNTRDILDASHLARIVEDLQRVGVAQILFSGGEPLTRSDDLARILKGARPETDFWVLTSGVGLTARRAHELRAAGLTGIALSLDHWDGARHDAFRGRRGTFAAALDAARFAHAAGLAVNLSLCPTRAMVSDADLHRYTVLARALGAGFVQVLEPRAVGRYAGADVGLTPGQRDCLDRFCDALASSPELPGPAYPARAARRLGCPGAGDRLLYVDAAGAVHPCPFCREPSGNVLQTPLPELRQAMAERGCPAVSVP